MTDQQRMESDLATMDKRDLADKTLQENRNRNDEITIARRSKADDTMEKHRIKNDEITANRRETKDENLNTALVMSLLIGLATGVTFMLL